MHKQYLSLNKKKIDLVLYPARVKGLGKYEKESSDISRKAIIQKQMDKKSTNICAF